MFSDHSRRSGAWGLLMAFALTSLSGFTFAQQTVPESGTDGIPVQALPSTPEQQKAEKKATQLEAVQVTGSRIKRSDSETEEPVVTLTRKDLERTGATTIGDILQTLPAAGAALNTTFNNGGTGATEIDLRNLGSNRVLVLVDGHRWVSGLRSLSTGSVDLNTIPFAIVDRIDVLQDGASAIYGSDAISGVVNIITRKRYEGVNVSSQYGSFTQGDGGQQLHSLAAGHTFGQFMGGETSVFGSLSFQDQQPVFAGNRALSALPLSGTGLSRASSFTPEGHYLFVPYNNTVADPTDIRNNLTACPGLVAGVATGVLAGGTSVDLPAAAGGAHIVTIPGQNIPLPDQASMTPGLNLCNLTHITGAGSASGNTASEYRAFNDPADRYNYATTNYLSTPLQTSNAFVAMNHNFGDVASFSFQFLHSERQSKQQLAPQPICIGEICPVIGGFVPSTIGSDSPISYNQASYITAASPFNPFMGATGQVIGCTNTTRSVNPCTDNTQPANNGTVTGQAGQTGLYGTGAILRRMVEGDPRIQLEHVPTDLGRVSLNGVAGLMNLPVDWEVGYSYGESRQKQTLFNDYDMSKILLGTSMACATTPGCVPLNFTGGAGTFTRDMLNYVEINETAYTRQSQSDFYFNASTTLPYFGGWLPAEPGVAFGVERRSSHYVDTPSIYAINNTTSGLTATPTDGSVSSKEAFVETDLPLIAGKPLIDKLDLVLAGRYSDYGKYGSSDNGKIGLKWKPYRDLLVRSTFSTSFRAPDVGDLFLSNAGSYPGLVDPCVSPATGSNAATNCNADYPGKTITQISQQILSPFKGNPNLKSETSHSFTGGFVFSPAQLTGLDFSVDYFKIALNDFITAPGGQYILDRCYNSAPNQRSFCGQVQRNSAGTLVQVFNSFANFPKNSTSGIDFQLSYTLPTTLVPALQDAGKFKLVTTATFLSNFDQSLLSDDGVTLTKTGIAGTLEYPRWKINPSLQWARGPLTASWNTRIVWGTWEDCFDGLSPSLQSLGLCSNPERISIDGFPSNLQMGYNYKPFKLNVGLGVQNILNRDPPVSYSSTNSFDPTYWIPGRLPYMNLKKDF
jgi:iron complex outermembrane recepter protein